jgi:hypothetical protein
MKTIEELKEKTMEFLDMAKKIVSEEDELDTAVFYALGNKYQSIPVRVEDQEDKDFLAGLIQSTAKLAEAMIVIVDTFVAGADGCKNLQEVNEKLPDSLESYEKTESALTAFIYTVEKTYTKTILYKRKDTKDYCFVEMGDWMEDPVEGCFCNPYLEKIGNEKN